jgi:NAD(P)-dependent dehydrogenase (short-subunit alcohol dehydrogenase family)
LTQFHPEPDPMPMTALVTGAAHRIGRALALSLAADGWLVALHYHRSAQAAQDLAQEIARAGGQAVPIDADLADEGEVGTLIPRLIGEVGPIGLLVNNASVFERDQAMTATRAWLEAHMRVNLFAPALLTRTLHAALTARGERGVAISLVDNKVFGLNPDYFSYTLSKVALQGMIQMQAMALAPTLRLAGIAPGITLISGLQTPEEFERSRRNNPMGMGCTPEQILNAIDFILATPAYHGQTLVIDGGQVLQRRPRDVVFLENPAAAKG